MIAGVDSPGHTFRTHMSVRARTDAQLRSAGPSAELRDTVDTQNTTGRPPPAFRGGRAERPRAAAVDVAPASAQEQTPVT